MSKLKSISTVIQFTTDTGFSSKANYKLPADAIDELARLMTVNGQEAEALKAVKDAITRTKADLKNRGLAAVERVRD